MSSLFDCPYPGAGLASDSRVRTPSGWKALDRLVVDEPVTALDGGASVVTGIFPRGEEQLHRITFSDRRTVECGARHPWTVHSDGWREPQISTVAEIARLLPQRMMWVEMPRGDFGHDDPLPMDPWMLGAVLADGAPDEPAAEGDEGDGGEAVAVTTATTRFNALESALRRLGLSGVAREREFIPDAFLNAARRNRLAVLQGLLDTDGEISAEGEISLQVVSERLASDVVDMVRSVGGWCRCETVRGTFVLHIGHPNPRLVFRLSSKKNRFLSGCADVARIAVVSIEPTRVAETRAISVSHPSGLFMTNDYLITH